MKNNNVILIKKKIINCTNNKINTSEIGSISERESFLYTSKSDHKKPATKHSTMPVIGLFYVKCLCEAVSRRDKLLYIPFFEFGISIKYSHNFF